MLVLKDFGSFPRVSLAIGLVFLASASSGSAATNEKNPVIKGTLIKSVTDEQHGGGFKHSHESYAIMPDDISQGSIPLSQDQSKALLGSKVSIRDSDPAQPGIQGTVASTSPASSSLAPGEIPYIPETPADSPKKTLVIPVNMTGQAIPNHIPGFLHRRYFTGVYSVNKLLKAQTNGRVRLTGIKNTSGDVTDQIKIDHPIGQACSDSELNAIRAKSIEKAKAAGWDVGSYDLISLVLPPQVRCQWLGKGGILGNTTWITSNTPGTFAFPMLVAHEIGHNLGLHHAGTVSCKDSSGKQVPVSNNCTKDEYGDINDPMGMGPMRFYSSWHRMIMGQLPKSNVKVVSASETVDLVTSSKPANPGNQLVLIPRIKTPEGWVRGWYALETRSNAFPFEVFTPVENTTNGVSIRMAPMSYISDPTHLVDAHPGGIFGSIPMANFLDSALQSGETFFDQDAGVKISPTKTSTGFRLKIEITK